MQLLDAVDRRQRLARVVRARQQKLTQLHDPPLAQPRQVHHARQRVQRLRRADVRCRLLAPDVLLARLQRQHEAAAPVDVLGFTGDPSRHAANLGLGGAEEAEGGAAVVQAVAERLALAEGNVCAGLTGRLEDPERHRVAGDDQERVVLLRRRAERRHALDRAEEVGALQDHRRGLAVDRRRQRRGVGRAGGQRDLDDLRPPAGGRRGQRLAAVGVHAAGDHEAPAAVGELGQVARGGERRGPLVDGRVGHGQAGEL